MGLLTTIWIFKVAEMESETVGESNENLMMPKKTLKPKKQTNKQKKTGEFPVKPRTCELELGRFPVLSMWEYFIFFCRFMDGRERGVEVWVGLWVVL